MSKCARLVKMCQNVSECIRTCPDAPDDGALRAAAGRTRAWFGRTAAKSMSECASVHLTSNVFTSSGCQSGGCQVPVAIIKRVSFSPPPPPRTDWTRLVPPSRTNGTRLVRPLRRRLSRQRGDDAAAAAAPAEARWGRGSSLVQRECTVGTWVGATVGRGGVEGVGEAHHMAGFHKAELRERALDLNVRRVRLVRGEGRGVSD